MPFESGHINKSVQATHVTFDEQIRAVFGLNMGTKAAVLLVLLGTDGAVKRAVVTEGVEDLAGRVLLPGYCDTDLAAPHSGHYSLGCPTGV